ncbi:hypothetical protein FN846DRAFT_574329 [Sphaerosporella brunnea]|uniref:Uncharacterized protein n=1 Tax=Sphaerosporella brunnea TaxID=1250544 RepID=A0A5J5F2A0_9PEZI|nr:hypothetical protein FN846DRAFT_574329 [Sphaerosporella brunnea]
MPVFREITTTSTGFTISNTEAWSYGSMCSGARQLGRSAGFKQDTTPYDMIRGAANKIEDIMSPPTEHRQLCGLSSGDTQTPYDQFKKPTSFITGYYISRRKSNMNKWTLEAKGAEVNPPKVLGLASTDGNVVCHNLSAAVRKEVKPVAGEVVVAREGGLRLGLDSTKERIPMCHAGAVSFYGNSLNKVGSPWARKHVRKHRLQQHLIRNESKGREGGNKQAYLSEHIDIDDA